MSGDPVLQGIESAYTRHFSCTGRACIYRSSLPAFYLIQECWTVLAVPGAWEVLMFPVHISDFLTPWLQPRQNPQSLQADCQLRVGYSPYQYTSTYIQAQSAAMPDAKAYTLNGYPSPLGGRLHMRPVLPAWQAARVSPKASRDCRALINLQLSTKQDSQKDLAGSMISKTGTAFGILQLLRRCCDCTSLNSLILHESLRTIEGRHLSTGKHETPRGAASVVGGYCVSAHSL